MNLGNKRDNYNMSPPRLHICLKKTTTFALALVCYLGTGFLFAETTLAAFLGVTFATISGAILTAKTIASGLPLEYAKAHAARSE